MFQNSSVILVNVAAHFILFEKLITFLQSILYPVFASSILRKAVIKLWLPLTLAATASA